MGKNTGGRGSPALALLEDTCDYLKGTAVSFAHGLPFAVDLKLESGAGASRVTW